MFITTLLTTLFLVTAIMTWQIAKTPRFESEANTQYLVFHLLSVGAVAGLLLNVLLVWLTSGSGLFN